MGLIQTGNIGNIAKGFYNNLLGKEEDLYKQRYSICKNCKLLKVDSIFGEICNSTLYLNIVTNVISPIEKEGFKNGCACVIKSKLRVKETNCPLNKW